MVGGRTPEFLYFRIRVCAPNHLELQTQSALNHTRPAPNKSGIGTNGSRGGGSHSRRDFAKVPAALVVLRIRKIRVVEQIERSEEHTSELQSPYDLVCRLLLEKK